MRSLHSVCGWATMWAGLFVVASLLVGCPGRKSDKEDGAKTLPLAGVKLRLLVVDDPGLAAAVRKVQGEWRAQTGATLEVAETTEAELVTAEKPDADAAICASYLLGTLAEHPGLAEIPAALRAEGQDDWMEVFELSRCHEVSWGSSILAVPFGSPVLVCYYRADLLAELRREPPQTWAEYEELAALLADRGKLGPRAPPAEVAWSGTMEPLGPGWGGLVLLARASSGVQHPDNYSTWFNIRSMEPLVDGPPMIRALVQLVETFKHGPAEQLDADPAAVRAAFWRGTCGMALSWPTAAGCKAADEANPKRGLPAGVAELPGSREHYDVNRRRWEKRDRRAEVGVPLLATSGRLGVVFKTARRPLAAAELLVWLSALRTDPPPAARSPWTTLFRRSQLGNAGNWVEASMSPAVAADYARQTEKTFNREQWTFALRIPGRGEYLTALDEAVAAAVRGEKAPAAALREAAGQWRKITERLGVEKQRAAYLQSLALEP